MKGTKRGTYVGYKRLYLCVELYDGQFYKLAYLMEDDNQHERLWHNNLSIRDNGGISIGTIIRYFKPDPCENHMPDGIPILHSRFACEIMLTQRYHR